MHAQHKGESAEAGDGLGDGAEPAKRVGMDRVEAGCEREREGQIEGEEIAALTIHYADGQDERLPIQHAVQVADAWSGASAVTKQAQAAWIGTTALANANQGAMRLYQYTWPNPHPDWEIAQVDLTSAKTKASYVLVAMTVE